MILYWLWLLGSAVVRRVPLRLSYTVAARGADLAWYLLPHKRANTVENMSQICRAAGHGSHARAARLGRRSFENYAKYVVDFMRHPTAGADEIMARIRFDGWETLDATLSSGRGTIFVLMHFGNWDIGAAVFALRGYRLSVVAETQPKGKLNEALVAARTVRGITLLPMERAASGIVRAMKRNESLAILIDRPLDEGGVEVEFFGGTVRIPEGPARIALRTGAKLIPVSMLRVAPNEDIIRAVLDFSIETVATGDQKRDVERLTQQLMAAHERVIRQYPEQWYMFRRMWPRRSPSERAASAAGRV